MRICRQTERGPEKGRFLWKWVGGCALVVVVGLVSAEAAERGANSAERELVSESSFSQVVRIFTLQDYNTRVVLAGTMLLGMAAGIIGSFMLLRKQALLGDALSHATLPGIGLAYILAVSMGMEGKSLPLLLLGASVTGVLGVLSIMCIDRFTRLKQDTALGIVLSVFFGGGVAILGIVQKMETGSAAGLESFIYGKTASMLANEAWMILIIALLVLVASFLLFKEFTVLSFDAAYTRCQGFSTLFLDVVMMGLVVTVTVVGLQAVGLILIIALLIIPAASARFWTNRMHVMLLISAGFGALSSGLGAALSGLYPKLPAGAMIVLVAATGFVLSMLFAPGRGAISRWVIHLRLVRNVARQHLLRAMYEYLEAASFASSRVELSPQTVSAVSIEDLLRRRSWSRGHLKRTLSSAMNDGLVVTENGSRYRLTREGFTNAARMTRNHRLWEMYLVTHADIAPSHVDRDAEEVEHVLGPEMVQRLEELLQKQAAESRMLPSPHLIPLMAAASTSRPGLTFHDREGPA